VSADTVFCPDCELYLKKHETYVLMFGEIICRHCDEWIGEFVDWEEGRE
jgi:uncharacterized protein YbaR (Trm112 family)